MKATFLTSVLVLGFSAFAQAGTVQISLGQTAQISAGDVAVVSANGQNAVVICSGAPTQPTQPETRNYEGRAIADLMLFEKPEEYERAKNWCLTMEPDYTADLRPAVRRALEQATNQCQLDGYRSCKQIGQPERKFLGRSPSGSGHQCAFRVFVRGSN